MTELAVPSDSSATMIAPTHKTGLACEVSDEHIFVGEGVMVETGKPKNVLASQRHERTRLFLSKVP